MKTLLQETVGILLPLVTLVEGSIFQVNIFNNDKALINKSISISQKKKHNLKFFLKELIVETLFINKIRCKSVKTI